MGHYWAEAIRPVSLTGAGLLGGHGDGRFGPRWSRRGPRCWKEDAEQSILPPELRIARGGIEMTLPAIAGSLCCAVFLFGCFQAFLGMPRIPFRESSKLRNALLKLRLVPLGGLGFLSACLVGICGITLMVGVVYLGFWRAEDVSSMEYGLGLSRVPLVIVGTIVFALLIIAAAGHCFAGVQRSTRRLLRTLAFSAAWRAERLAPFVAIFRDPASSWRVRQIAAAYVCGKLEHLPNKQELLLAFRRELGARPPHRLWADVIETLVALPSERHLLPLEKALTTDSLDVRQNAVAALAVLFPALDLGVDLGDPSTREERERAREWLGRQAPSAAGDRQKQRHLAELVTRTACHPHADRWVKSSAKKLIATLEQDEAATIPELATYRVAARLDRDRTLFEPVGTSAGTEGIADEYQRLRERCEKLRASLLAGDTAAFDQRLGRETHAYCIPAILLAMSPPQERSALVAGLLDSKQPVVADEVKLFLERELLLRRRQMLEWALPGFVTLAFMLSGGVAALMTGEVNLASALLAVCGAISLLMFLGFMSWRRLRARVHNDLADVESVLRPTGPAQ